METTIAVGMCASCGQPHDAVHIDMLAVSMQTQDLIAGYSAVKIGQFVCPTTEAVVYIEQILA